MSATQPATAGVIEQPHALIESLNALCQQWLAPALRLLKEGSLVPREKVINDGLWHTIRLHPWEVAVVDTRLMQRLREIRQLGVIHWVFPTAAHSRFEHSLGTVHQVQALIDGIERNSSLAGEPLIDEELKYLLRLAALLHDCGHAVMSHVSEDVISELPGVQQLMEWTYQTYVTWKVPSPSEAIAAVFVRSPAFRELLTRPAVGADFIKDVDAACLTIATLIVGGVIAPGREYISLLLNGAFDADKLDYMPRDCVMAGVPCSIDIDRLIEKIQVIKVPRRLLEDTNYLTWLFRVDPEDTRDPVAVLSVGGSGRVVREFAEMRAVLFDKVYQHQKVRAIEKVAQRMFRDLRQRPKYGSLREWLALTDSHLTRLKHRTSDLFADRLLPKRAFSLKVNEPDDNSPAAQSWRRLRADAKLDDLSDSIRSAARDSSRLLKNHCAGADYGLSQLGVEVDIVDRSRHVLEGFPFSGDGESDFVDHSIIFRRHRENDGDHRYELRVYAAEPAIVPVFFASRKIVATRYHQTVPPAACDGLKLDPDELSKYDELLAEGHFYDEDVPPREPFKSLRIITHAEAAMEKFLKAAWPRVAALGERFGRYQSVVATTVSSVQVARYLRQFGTEARARAALDLLESLNMIDRTQFVQRLQFEIARARKSGDVAFVSPLGATGDSSAFLWYLMNDVDETERVDVAQVEIALAKDWDRQILLWDDFCGTGRHAICALSQWLDFDGPENCKTLVRPLTRTQRRQFKNRQITLCFALAMPGGIANVERTLRENGYNEVTVVMPPEPLPQIDSYFTEPGADLDARKDLREFLERKAREVLAITRRELPQTERENRLLGFNNAAQRVVFYYNVPNATITALWEGAPGVWEPLFRRRHKKPLPHRAPSHS